MENAKQNLGPPTLRMGELCDGGREGWVVEGLHGRHISCMARRARTLKGGSSFIDAPLGFVPWWILLILQ